jgi:3-keto-5-aminohexanoate cleavage enzyme
MDRDVVILTCAVSGTTFPRTAAEHAEEARRARDAGASVIHVLPRHPDGTPSYEVEDALALVDAVRTSAPDVVVSLGAGNAGGILEQRVACLERARPDIAAIRMGPSDAAPLSPTDPFKAIVALLATTTRLSIRAEHQCFDSGHVARLDPLLDLDVLDTPLLISMVMGVPGGIRATARNLAHMADQVPGGPDGPHNWGLVAKGPEQWPLAAAALAFGGNIRVGLEDNERLPDRRVARSNGDLADVGRRLVELTGRCVATCSQARELLGVPRPAPAPA